HNLTHSFFLSSRRRHTRFSRDWSSDVCSSDLVRVVAILPACAPRPVGSWLSTHECLRHLVERGHDVVAVAARTYEPAYTHEGVRSEERREGIKGRTSKREEDYVHGNT